MVENSLTLRHSTTLSIKLAEFVAAIKRGRGFFQNFDMHPSALDAKPSIANMTGKHDSCLSVASSRVPSHIEKRREPVGQAWDAFLFGSFILGKQNK